MAAARGGTPGRPAVIPAPRGGTIRAGAVSPGKEPFVRRFVCRPALRLLFAVLLLVLAPAAPRRVEAAPPPLPSYSFDVNLDYTRATLVVGQVTRFRNTTGQPLDRAVFNVVPAALGAFDLAGTSVGGQPASTSRDGSVLEVLLPSILPPGAEAELELSYRLRVPAGGGRTGAGQHALALGNWFPILSPYRGDWERNPYTEVGDPGVSEVANFDLRLTTSIPLVVAAGGDVAREDDTHVRITASGQRDLALSLSPEYAVAAAAAGSTVVRGYATDPVRARVFADTAARYLAWYGARFGAYPYATLALAETELPAIWAGLEYPRQIFVSSTLRLPATLDGSDLESLIAHETTHQWFYGLVGNDQVRAPWLDEAFAEYLPAYYERQTRPDRAELLWQQRIAAGLDERVRAAGNRPVDSTVYDFPDNPPYITIVYSRGARLLDDLRAALGEAAFEAALADEVRVFSGKLASPLAVLDLFQRHSPVNLNPLLAGYLSYPAVQDPQPPDWEVDLPPLPWRGSRSLLVRAAFPLSRLEVWLDGRLLASGPSSAPNLDLSGVEPGEYLLLVRAWDERGVAFERAERVAVEAP